MQKAEAAVAAMKERATFVNDLWDLCRFFFVAPKEFNEKDVQKRWKPETPAMLTDLHAFLQTLDTFDNAEQTEATVKAWCEEKGYGLGNVKASFDFLYFFLAEYSMPSITQKRVSSGYMLTSFFSSGTTFFS